MPETPTSFESRKALPEAWRGVRDEALSGLIGIEGAVFCHASGFIGGALPGPQENGIWAGLMRKWHGRAGNKTKEGALEMARKAIAA